MEKNNYQIQQNEAKALEEYKATLEKICVYKKTLPTSAAELHVKIMKGEKIVLKKLFM